MTYIFDETHHLRGRVRKEWPERRFGELIWVEAARGGTVGAPDVNLPLGVGHGYLPVELKAWETNAGDMLRRGYVQFVARPSQRHFHRLAALSGNRTAFLAVLSDGSAVTIPNWRMPPNGTWMNTLVTRIGKASLESLRELYRTESFWEDGRKETMEAIRKLEDVG
jgi:hypothetical protein